MDFGSALKAARDGKRIARSGWNGKGMWVAQYPRQFLRPSEISLHEEVFQWAYKFWNDDEFAKPIRVEPFLVMKTAQDTLVYGWLASQTDMLADDWFVVEEE
jgi:hypothetical protein